MKEAHEFGMDLGFDDTFVGGGCGEHTETSVVFWNMVGYQCRMGMGRLVGRTTRTGGVDDMLLVIGTVGIA
jgi:hypothetical protein